MKVLARGILLKINFKNIQLDKYGKFRRLTYERSTNFLQRWLYKEERFNNENISILYLGKKFIDIDCLLCKKKINHEKIVFNIEKFNFSLVCVKSTTSCGSHVYIFETNKRKIREIRITLNKFLPKNLYFDLFCKFVPLPKLSYSTFVKEQKIWIIVNLNLMKKIKPNLK